MRLYIRGGGIIVFWKKKMESTIRLSQQVQLGLCGYETDMRIPIAWAYTGEVLENSPRWSRVPFHASLATSLRVTNTMPCRDLYLPYWRQLKLLKLSLVISTAIAVTMEIALAAVI